MARTYHLAERECVAAAIAAAEAANTLADLYGAIEQYRGHDVAIREPYSPSQESPFANPLMIVTEKPEPEDRVEGRPFSGSYGRVMRNAASMVGIDLGACHIAYAVRWLPDEEKSPNKTQIAASRPFIMKEIELVRPRAILAQGRGVIDSLASWRGNVLELYGQTMGYDNEGEAIQMFMTAHPKFCEYNGTYFSTFVENTREFFERFGREEEGTSPGSFRGAQEAGDLTFQRISKAA